MIALLIFTSLLTRASTMSVKTATFGAGCFWSPQRKFTSVDGVKKVTAGFTGDSKLEKKPSYELVCSGKTNLVEAVRIEYDDDVISFDDLLVKFEEFADSKRGRQYQAVVFTDDDEEKEAVARVLPSTSASIESASSTFWRAEKYHQNYYSKWALRIPLVLLLLYANANPQGFLPEAVQQGAFYLYLAGILAVILERKLDRDVIPLNNNNGRE
ncbi:hypothetical protein TrCOL_g12327 [Triparma columacea]|uniref:peptide-methionine (S)-S-oxide reductase n=1 Tax=Triparma columacea TaxID=722753 RepID=A0A9W7L1B0_9STRA|nr:hypothetical protein TrCOL_g12327 [Triparma columacea]